MTRFMTPSAAQSLALFFSGLALGMSLTSLLYAGAFKWLF